MSELTMAQDRQCRQALRLANRIRIKRANLKKDVAAGDLTAQEVLTDHRGTCRNMSIGELLRAQPRWGKKRVNRFLSRLRLTEGKSIGSMTERQIWIVIEALKEKR